MKQEKRFDLIDFTLGLALVAFLLLGAALSFATEDVTGPAVTSFSASPVSINTSAGSQTVTFTLTITDGLSGVKAGSIYIISPTAGVNYGQSVNVGFNAGNLTSGNANSGTYTVTASFPQYSNVGTWTVQNVAVYDNCGSWTSYAAGNAIFGSYGTITTY